MNMYIRVKSMLIYHTKAAKITVITFYCVHMLNKSQISKQILCETYCILKLPNGNI